MNIILRILKVKDITKEYINWFSDKDVVKFSNNQYKKFTITTQKKYVQQCLKDKNLVLFGIFYKKKHIGNICLKGLQEPNKIGSITYVIGDKKFWNIGVGSFVIKKIIFIAKKKYKLRQIIAGVAHKNFGSIKILEKNKFKLHYIKKKQLLFNNTFYDQLNYKLIL